MAFKYPTGKFDDPGKSVSQSSKKIYDATFDESLRRALQGVLNRVLWGTSGTITTTTVKTGCQTGGDSATDGIGVSVPIHVIINGVLGTRGTAGNYKLPAGTQAANTFVKYLISGPINSTAGTVTLGNEGETAAKALLPDCPDGHVALGYMLYATTAGTAFDRSSNQLAALTGAAGTFSFVDLMHMPYDG
jgi:hypothetical protein